MSVRGGELLSATTSDGVTLALRYVAAAGARRAVCLCTHAMMANSRYFWTPAHGGVAEYLSQRGADVYILDWRGHGGSRMPRGADWCFDDHVLHDAPAAVRAVCAHADIAPRELVYLGHSLGGLVGLAASATATIPRVRALALLSTSVWMPGRHGSFTRRAIMAALAMVTRVLGHAPTRALRIGPENEPRGFVEQLTTWAREGAWRSRAGLDYLAQLERIDVPIWAASGDGDRLCRPDDANVLVARLRGAGELIRVGRATGFAEDADHFSLLTSPAFLPLFDRLLAFIDHTPAA